LRNDITRAAFASTTLSSYTKFELHFVKRHSRTRMTRDLAIRNSTANANDHGSEAQLAGCYLRLNYKYESVAFAITMIYEWVNGGGDSRVRFAGVLDRM